jgi:hypothetical protein
MAKPSCKDSGLTPDLLNPLKNASESIASGGRFPAGASDDVLDEGPGKIGISIFDRGPGITAENFSRLCARALRTPAGSDREFGFADSLAIVQRLSLHGVSRRRRGRDLVLETFSQANG